MVSYAPIVTSTSGHSCSHRPKPIEAIPVNRELRIEYLPLADG